MSYIYIYIYIYTINGIAYKLTCSILNNSESILINVYANATDHN